MKTHKNSKSSRSPSRLLVAASGRPTGRRSSALQPRSQHSHPRCRLPPMPPPMRPRNRHARLSARPKSRDGLDAGRDQRSARPGRVGPTAQASMRSATPSMADRRARSTTVWAEPSCVFGHTRSSLRAKLYVRLPLGLSWCPARVCTVWYSFARDVFMLCAKNDMYEAQFCNQKIQPPNEVPLKVLPDNCVVKCYLGHMR